jgi:hypothetical protein
MRDPLVDAFQSVTLKENNLELINDVSDIGNNIAKFVSSTISSDSPRRDANNTHPVVVRMHSDQDSTQHDDMNSKSQKTDDALVGV